MKKAAKISLITAVIIMLAGIVLYVVGYALGGREQMVSMMENGEVRFFGKTVQLDFSLGDGDGIAFGIFSDTSGNIASNEIMNYIYNTEETQKLDIQLDAGSVTVTEADVDTVQINVSGSGESKCYTKNGTLYVEGSGKDGMFLFSFGENGVGNFDIIVPKGFSFTETDIEIGAGSVEVSDVDLGATNVHIDAGQLVCENTGTTTLDVSVDMGAVHMSNLRNENGTTVAVDMGDATLAGVFEKNIDLNCDMGSISLQVDGKENDYNYEVEADMGQVTIGSGSSAGMSASQTINNNADKTITADTDMGTILIQFTK